MVESREQAREHWEEVWGRVESDAVSWYQAAPEPCLTQVRELTSLGDHVAVMGAGTSALVVELARHGYTDIEAVDISQGALDRLGAELGELEVAGVTLRRADVRQVGFDRPLDLWHDRATFHFLTDPDDQQRYAEQAAVAVRPGGALVMATFALGGPEMCSGLPVQRYDAAALADRFSPAFEQVDAFERVHQTPSQVPQAFVHTVFRRGS